MLSNIVKTKEIESIVLNNMKSSSYYNQLKFSLNNIYYFTNKLSVPGTYIYSDGTKYHLISIGDRGKRSKEKITKNIEEFYFDIYDSLAFSVALKIADKNKKEDFRRELFKCQLRILSSIDTVYEEKGRKKIEKILLENPYDDTLY